MSDTQPTNDVPQYQEPMLLPAYTNPERRERLLRKYHMVTRCDYSRLTPMERFQYEQAYTMLLLNTTRYGFDNGSRIAALFHYLDDNDITRYKAVLHDMFDISHWPAEYKARMIARAHEYVKLRKEARNIDINAREGYRNYRNALTEALSIRDETLHELMDAFLARRHEQTVATIYQVEGSQVVVIPFVQMALLEVV